MLTLWTIKLFGEFLIGYVWGINEVYMDYISHIVGIMIVGWGENALW